MRSCTRIAATVLLGLAGALVTVSCIQAAPPAPETDGARAHASMLSTQDDDDSLGGDPDMGDGIGSESPAGDRWSEPPVDASMAVRGESSGPKVSENLALDACIAAGKVGFEVRRAFCNSAFVPPNKKQGCWQHLLLSRAEWIGWCYWNF